MTGLSFFDLLNEMRIGKTADYLLYTDLTLKELAEILGYVDESHISKVFAARLGTRIGQYRATYQKVQNICQLEESRLGCSLVNHIYRHYREWPGPSAFPCSSSTAPCCARWSRILRISWPWSG